MRPAYCAQAVSAQAGSLWPTATTRSLGTRLSLCGALRLGLQTHRSCAPDLLEVVELARRRMHDVHDHVAEVHQDPLAARFALDAIDAGAEDRELLLQVIGERPDLPGRIAARDDHALEHRWHGGRVVDRD